MSTKRFRERNHSHATSHEVILHTVYVIPCLEGAVCWRLAGDGPGSGGERPHLVLPLIVLAADGHDLDGVHQGYSM